MFHEDTYVASVLDSTQTLQLFHQRSNKAIKPSEPAGLRIGAKLGMSTKPV